MTDELRKVLRITEKVQVFDGDYNAQEKVKVIMNDLIQYYESYMATVRKDFNQNEEDNRWQNLDVRQDMTVLTEDGERYSIKRDASNYITIEGQMTGQKYGTHKVIAYPPKQENQAYYKFKPYAPGIEYAVASLSDQILLNLTAETKLISLSDGKREPVTYLASKGVLGMNFADVINKQDLVKLIDMKNFSGTIYMLFADMLRGCKAR